MSVQKQLQLLHLLLFGFLHFGIVLLFPKNNWQDAWQQGLIAEGSILIGFLLGAIYYFLQKRKKRNRACQIYFLMAMSLEIIFLISNYL